MNMDGNCQPILTPILISAGGVRRYLQQDPNLDKPEPKLKDKREKT